MVALYQIVGLAWGDSIPRRRRRNAPESSGGEIGTQAVRGGVRQPPVILVDADLAGPRDRDHQFEPPQLTERTRRTATN